ncbi:MAG: hypothetical protein ACYC1D_09655 [Acidimicrobiales bacterium]
MLPVGGAPFADEPLVLVQEAGTAYRAEVPFDPEEAAYLGELELELRRVEEWPVDSPLGFVIHLAPRTRGKLGEHLVAKIATKLGVVNTPSASADFDLAITRRSGLTKAEVKFSTEDPPRFQQVRDPRRQGAMKYDALVCLSGRPEGLLYWVLEAHAVASLIDSGAIYIQHQDSNTHWFYPSRLAQDGFAAYRRDFRQLKHWLTS